MVHVRGFPPIARPDARLLILGTMPSRASLAAARYYAHPRNAFWPILTELLQIDAPDYAARAVAVTARGVAIWDVLQACFRSGSLDSAIDESSVVTNDFAGFYQRHRGIERVFFNGARAESLYRRHVLPTLDEDAARLSLRRLPSTSPAHAGMSLADKTAAWRAILD
jgi:hypoxanthine-DNA glycosylase